MKLKTYKFNEDFFELMKGDDYEGLKNDIKKNGIKTELHVLQDGTVLCGNQRLRIVNELGINHDDVPIKIITHLNTDDEIKEYVIKDNLLRRHLKPEQRATLEYELYNIKFKGSGGNRKEQKSQDATFDVFQEIAEETGQDRATVARHIQFQKAVNKEPEKYKGKKISQVLKAVKIEKQQAIIKKLIPEKKIKGVFNIIVIDPPWKYDDVLDPNGNRGTCKYPTMTIEELKKLKIPADEDCVLWLWVTNSFMEDGYELLREWGFSARTILTWDKVNKGMGNYLGNVTEHCILAIKGNPLGKGIIENKKYKWSTLLQEKRTTHSTKPEIFYTMVDEICAGRKLDYFARKKREGWDVYGDEV